jgi:hypothetical protein
MADSNHPTGSICSKIAGDSQDIDFVIEWMVYAGYIGGCSANREDVEKMDDKLSTVMDRLFKVEGDIHKAKMTSQS